MGQEIFQVMPHLLLQSIQFLDPKLKISLNNRIGLLENVSFNKMVLV